MGRLFYVERRTECNSTDPYANDNVCRNTRAHVVEIGDGEEIPRVGESNFHPCASVGNDECDTCSGYTITVTAVREYDSAFREMLEAAKKDGKLEELVAA